MRNERKYKIISLLTTLLSILLLGTCIREPWRLAAAEVRQNQEWVQKGARAYAQNCVQCHGPRGEGVIGMPLNRTAYKVDFKSPAGKEAYNILYRAIEQGRKGNDRHFQWERMPDGNWLSYSTMPAWGKAYGGPMDEDYVKALTLFIMNADGEQWLMVGDRDYAPYQDPDFSVGEDGKIPLPDAVGVDAQTNATAKALLRELGKSQCLTCHTIGSRGGFIGPDLTYVGSWGFDQAFLEEWIKYPGGGGTPPGQEMKHERRMPVYWSANRAAVSPELNLKAQVVSEGPYFMPRVNLTDAEIAILAKYLMGLKAK